MLKRDITLLGLLMFILLIFVYSCTNHKELDKSDSVFYVVQPAEHHNFFNGHLTWQGRKRAGDLMRFLEDSSIQKIYVSSFSRSFETADSLKNLQKIDTVEYEIDSTGENVLLQIERNKDFGKKILLVLEPGSIPQVTKLLGLGSEEGEKTSPHDKNILLRIENNHGEVKSHRLTFGEEPQLAVDSADQR